MQRVEAPFEESAKAMEYELQGKRVWVCGHRGMVGGALLRRLRGRGAEALTATRAECDLRRQDLVEEWMRAQRPDVVILAAAKVGGILANQTYPADFLYENLMIEANVIHAAYQIGVEKLLFIASSSIYPKFTAQPIAEAALLTASLEPTHECYAIAKIAGIKLCQAYRQQYGARFISVVPTNLYGPGDSFDLKTSHVLPALLRKAHDLKMRGDGMLELWGSGTPRREFLFADDFADGCLFVLEHYDEADHVNVGYGDDVTTHELARLILGVVGVAADIRLDPTKPDGTPRKLLDSSRINALGWRPAHTLEEGIKATYSWFLANQHRF